MSSSFFVTKISENTPQSTSMFFGGVTKKVWSYIQQRLCDSGGAPPSPKLPYATLRATSHSRNRYRQVFCKTISILIKPFYVFFSFIDKFFITPKQHFCKLKLTSLKHQSLQKSYFDLQTRLIQLYFMYLANSN